MHMQVANGRSVRHGLKTWGSGDRIEDSDIPRDRAEHLCNRGFIEIVCATAEPVVKKSRSKKAEKDKAEDDKSGGRTGLVTPSQWTFKPADLAGKTLDELNAMIVERTQEVEPFTTVEEAVAFLSQHAED